MTREAQKTKASAHLLIVGGVFVATTVAIVAINWSGVLRGYNASRLVGGRDLAFILLLAGTLLWLVRSQKYRGSLVVYTAAVLLFSVGLVVQYRLFSDPEYGAKGGERAESRRSKGGAV